MGNPFLFLRGNRQIRSELLHIAKATLDKSLTFGMGTDGTTPNVLQGNVELTFEGTNGNADVTVDLTENMTKDQVMDSLSQVDGVEAGLDTDDAIVLTGSGLEKYSGVTSDIDAATPANTDSIDLSTGYLTDIDITDQAGAQEAIQILDAALAQVDGERAEPGAVQNRLDYTISNLQNMQENLSTSQSRTQDVDFASETTEPTKNQMMMQAGTTVLAQTKQTPQYAVQLLG